MEIIKTYNWGLNFPIKEPLLIAGPCSAETPQQVLESTQGAVRQGAHLLRAGIWKPRTRPNSFEGVGQKGLTWLQEASRVTGKPVTVEVANARHAEAALQAEVDVLWIGARTTVNPFAVQDIADALRGVDIPVMVKNPVNPDLELWIGALERMHSVGIHKLAAIHRGFSVYKPHHYRNLPMWEIPIELRRRIPNLEIICDPSHIAGKRALLHEISQKSCDLAFDGLMIETHIQPEEALSDAAQQVTPKDLGKLLNQLVWRKPDTTDADFLANIDALRYDIDRLDEEVIQLLSKRKEVVQEIGRYKRDNGVTILQMNRWSRIFDSRVQATIQAGLSEDFAAAFVQILHRESNSATNPGYEPAS